MSVTTEGQIQAELNGIMSVLGTTKPNLWPFLEATGVLVSGIGGGGDLVPSETAGAAEALEDDFAPVKGPGGIYSYHFHPTGDHHLAGSDHGDFSFGDGTVDSPFSVGAFIRPNVANLTILGKHDSAGNLEEWKFYIDSNGKLALELHDASASATEIGTATNALTAGQMIFAVATYDGDEADPAVNIYADAVLASDGLTVETSAYVAMENTATPLTAFCAGVTAAPVLEFHGRGALPFVTGKELSLAEVQELYARGRRLLGL